MVFGDLETLGLHVSLLLAGFFGGLCNISIRSRRPDPWSACSGIIVGTLTGNYLAATAVKLFPVLGTGAEIGAFTIGVCGIEVCRRFIKTAGDEPVRTTKEIKP